MATGFLSCGADAHVENSGIRVLNSAEIATASESGRKWNDEFQSLVEVFLSRSAGRKVDPGDLVQSYAIAEQVKALYIEFVAEAEQVARDVASLASKGASKKGSGLTHFFFDGVYYTVAVGDKDRTVLAAELRAFNGALEAIVGHKVSEQAGPAGEGGKAGKSGKSAKSGKSGKKGKVKSTKAAESDAAAPAPAKKSKGSKGKKSSKGEGAGEKATGKAKKGSGKGSKGKKASGSKAKAAPVVTEGAGAVHFPLMALFDFAGRTVLAVAEVPVTKETASAPSAAADAAAARACQAVGAAKASKVERHTGTDGRSYVLGLASVLPAAKDEVGGAHRPELASFGVSGKDLEEGEYLSQVATTLRQMPLEPDAGQNVRKIMQVLHEHGIGMRRLAQLLRFFPVPDLTGVRAAVLLEMSARALKSLVRDAWRGVSNVDDETALRAAAAKVINKLLHEDEKHEDAWQADLKERIALKFGESALQDDEADLDTNLLDDYLSVSELVARAGELTGFTVDPKAAYVLRDARRFEGRHISRISVVSKTLVLKSVLTHRVALLPLLYHSKEKADTVRVAAESALAQVQIELNKALAAATGDSTVAAAANLRSIEGYYNVGLFTLLKARAAPAAEALAEYEAAKVAFEAVLKRDFEHADAHFALGLALFEGSEHQLDIKAKRSAILFAQERQARAQKLDPLYAELGAVLTPTLENDIRQTDYYKGKMRRRSMLPVDSEVIEALLNHEALDDSEGSEGSYYEYSYDDEEQ
jgi:hypothetical protein